MPSGEAETIDRRAVADFPKEKDGGKDMPKKIRVLVYLAANPAEIASLEATAAREKAEYEEKGIRMAVFSSNDNGIVRMVVLVEEDENAELGEAPWRDGGYSPGALREHFFCQFHKDLSVGMDAWLSA
jgi:hypothetical protein